MNRMSLFKISPEMLCVIKIFVFKKKSKHIKPVHFALLLCLHTFFYKNEFGLKHKQTATFICTRNLKPLACLENVTH